MHHSETPSPSKVSPGLTRACSAVALVSLLGASPPRARAEIAIGESVEWLTASAKWVLVGRITSVRDVDPRGQGKNADLQLLAVQVTGVLKGPLALGKVCVAVRQSGLKDAQVLRQKRTELVFFLGQTVQATSFEGLTCNLWPLRGGDALPAILPLDSPGKRLLSASSWKVLRRRADVLQAVRDTARRLASTRAGAGAGAAKSGSTGLGVTMPLAKHYLEVPFSSEVHQVLYGGSACYLIVPQSLFPKARPRLGR